RLDRGRPPPHRLRGERVPQDPAQARVRGRIDARQAERYALCRRPPEPGARPTPFRAPEVAREPSIVPDDRGRLVVAADHPDTGQHPTHRPRLGPFSEQCGWVALQSSDRLGAKPGPRNTVRFGVDSLFHVTWRRKRSTVIERMAPALGWAEADAENSSRSDSNPI